MAAGRYSPRASTPLIGRAEQVEALRSALVTGPSQLVTVTGPPGVGKTRLALELAAVLADDFADGVAWVDLTSIRDVAQVPTHLTLGPDVARVGDRSSLDGVVTALADRDLLLVLDNCEHLLHAAGPTSIGELVGELIARLPRLRVLATSRRRLHLAAETEYLVPPLAMPAVLDAGVLDRLAGNPSIALLLARAPAHVTLGRRTARALVDVCLGLDGLPLALELAAARLRVFTPAELAFRLEHRTTELTGAPRDAPARHRTLLAAIEWSHDLLPEAERTVFARLSVLVGDWTVAAAEQVCGPSAPAVLAAVESLLEQSLIQRVPHDGPARFAMLSSIHDYAAGQLALRGEVDATRDRHVRHFAAVGEAWEADLGTEAENGAWADFESSHPDLSAAFEHSASGIERAWLGVALAWYGHVHGSLGRTDSVLDALHELEPPTPTPTPSGALDGGTRTAVLTAAGVIGLGLGRLDRADQDLRAAVESSRATGDDRRRAVALSFLGHVTRGLGRASEAAALYRSAREISVARGNIRGTAWSAFDLGLLAVDGSDPAQRAAAEPLLREALGYFEVLDYDWAVAQAARALAVALLDRDADAEAAALLGRALTLHAAVGDRRGSAQCLEALAEVAVRTGRPTAAARLLGAAQGEREVGGSVPTDPERQRVAHLGQAIDAALGRAGAEHGTHAGRTSGRAAVLALAAGVAEPAAPDPPTPGVEALTARQSEVAALIATGSTNRQIGRALGISEKTAEIHVSNILLRLNVPSRAGVATWVTARSSTTP